MTTPRGIGLARRAAIAYTGAFALGSVISVRRGYTAEALGIRTGWDVRKGVLTGLYGAGLAAPWNMIVQLWTALTLAQRPSPAGRRARAWLAFLSAMFLAGSVAEPVSHRVVTASCRRPMRPLRSPTSSCRSRSSAAR